MHLRRRPSARSPLSFTPQPLSLEEMIKRLRVLSPRDVDAITILVDHTLKRRWAAQQRQSLATH